MLHDHLADVACRAKDIASRMSVSVKDDAFVAGLLHDIGKLNPWYQEFFARRRQKADLEETYGRRQHAGFSAWAARHLLYGRKKSQQHYVIHAVAGHHTRLGTYIYAPKDPKSTRAQKEMLDNLHQFKDFVCADNAVHSDEWNDLKWDDCLKDFSGIPTQNGIDFIGSIETYMRAKCVFSALLQADRGSFHGHRQHAKFSIGIQTTHIGDSDSDISKMRKSFQDMAFKSYVQNINAGVIIIEAPTGIGKTDLIFRILGYHSEQQSHDRAFYFSPLLALTDGFIMALREGHGGTRPGIFDKDDERYILEYNHMTKEAISDRRDRESGESFDRIEDREQRIADREQKNATLFDVNSFNYPFIVSTTIRLLLTLYGNSVSSCIKFASLSKSIIIVDEIQTVPKSLLPSLVQMLSWVAKSSNSKVILVSATIPAELSNMNLCKIKCDNRIFTDFMEHTPKILSTASSLNLKCVLDAAPSLTAVMFNTRAAARRFQLNRDALLECYDNMLYLTSGIRKRDRLEHIRNIVASAGQAQSTVVISTQVLEAGVDASFERMFRQMAPMDNIVQAMGRLNRHGNTDAAKITVFDRDPPRPYRGIEIKKTQDILDELTADGETTSTDVYKKIRDYYAAVTKDDMKSMGVAKKLENNMTEHNYDKVWEIVSHETGRADHNVEVILPYPYETLGVDSTMHVDTLCRELNESVRSGHDRSRRHPVWKRTAQLSASLPAHALADVRDLMDKSMLDLGIYIPRDNDAISALYDKEIGLDKWVLEDRATC